MVRLGLGAMSTAKAKHLLDSIGTEAAVETNQR